MDRSVAMRSPAHWPVRGSRRVFLALAALFPLAGCIHRPDPGLDRPGSAALRLYVASTILTMDPDHPRAQALLVEGDRVAAVGSAAELEVAHPSAERILLPPGAVVIPGFDDAHLHLSLGALLLEARPLPDAQTDLPAALAALARSAPPGWLMVKTTAFPEKWTAADLDRLVGRRPVLVLANQGLLLSGAALDALGLRQRLPTGVAQGADTAPVLTAVARVGLGRERVMRSVRAFLADARRFGITSAQVMNDDLQDWLEPLRATGELTCRIRFAPIGLAVGGAHLPPHSTGGDSLWLRTVGQKFFLDDDAPLSDAQLKALVDGATPRAQAVVHVLGTKNLERLLRVLESTPGDHDVRIEHADDVTDGQAARLAKLQVTVCSNATLIPEWNRPQSFPLRRLLDHGVSLCLASDWVEGARPLDPLVALRWAVDRPDHVREQQLTAEEALRAMTLGGAKAEHLEGVKGSLRAGMLADFVVLSGDPTGVAADALPAVHVLQTVVGGRSVYQAEVAHGGRSR